MDKSNRESVPQHVAIIMDGNRRWARQQGLPVSAGHKRVVDVVIEELIETAAELEIPYITFWAWSSENWRRPELEVTGIMNLFRWGLKRKMKRFIERGARLNVIGNWQALESDIVEGIQAALDASRDNTRITVTFAINYGGRDELLRAIKKLETDVHGSNLEIQNLDTHTFSQYLDTNELPDPDLIVRPGGEQRLSGFLLWQAEYSELMFPTVMMPDFRKDNFLEVIEAYGQRKRRFGS